MDAKDLVGVPMQEIPKYLLKCKVQHMLDDGYYQEDIIDALLEVAAELEVWRG